ncbi:MobF family relaxase [Chryseolinea sp. H1M3-3]|uniref:MobF family relaxase n=1 Tax=Chryseolinea sp. H1M3-3 TaxID=3034144 RepID=UPI0023EC91F2|nr:MobF family relaxase [Chryseolinea sp. H1M3-3]
MIQSTSAGHAKAYFNEALLKSDYFLNDQELPGHFHGKIARRIGIEGNAAKETFHALCENINPKTGDTLTQRTIEQRTVGYDINFHCPKSVSIVHALSKDDHVMEAFKSSVMETMLDIEADSKTRVRKGGQYSDRETGELVWADFVHQTARPVDGAVPDPHLHSHCFVFNVTWDKMEEQFKAGQFRDVKRDMPYYQARFHKRLSDNLMELGYRVRQTEKSFEIEGVPQKAIDLFSKRTDEIGRIAKEKNITDVKELDQLGAKTRSKKQKGLTLDELKRHWREQIREAGAGSDSDDGRSIIRNNPAKETLELSPEQCVDHAVQHRFERASVMQDRRILETAYRHSLGDRSVTLDEITTSFQNDKRILHVPDRKATICTTKEVLAEEKRMVELAQKSKGKFRPLYTMVPDIKLKGEQHEAVRHVLTTPHGVSIIRGRAGTGKTTLTTEAVKLMETVGCKVTMVAPTSQASRGVLREEGFAHADTVAKLLVDHNLQKGLKNGVLWVDEAGLLGTQDMTALLDLTARQNARLILSGDTRQHASVIRGDALRILNTAAGIRSAEVSRIYRQKNETYREAVQALSDGDVKLAFEKLDTIESIKTINPLKPNETLVEDYLATVKKGKSTLIISPTHQQGEEVTKAIRDKLRCAKMIGKREITATRFMNLNLTEAEKNDIRSYKQGTVLQFSQNMKGVKRGTVWSVSSVKDDYIHIKNEDGTSVDLPLDQNKKFEAFRRADIQLSKGDKIRLTYNGFDANKKRLNNGQILEVVAVRKNGHIKVRNAISKTNYTIPKDYGHIAHAHCITSYASQGKTVDEVFIAQPASTFPATDMKQFYVSVSRGRERVRIYTDDKTALLNYASEMRDRQSAIELIGKDYSKDTAQRLSRENMERQLSQEVRAKSIEKSDIERIKNHEPELEI